MRKLFEFILKSNTKENIKDCSWNVMAMRGLKYCCFVNKYKHSHLWYICFLLDPKQAITQLHRRFSSNCLLDRVGNKEFLRWFPWVTNRVSAYLLKMPEDILKTTFNGCKSRLWSELESPVIWLLQIHSKFDFVSKERSCWAEYDKQELDIDCVKTRQCYG